MEVVNFIWDYVIVFLFVLTVLIFIHEMGHFLVARYNRVRVDVFSIGFGPEIYGWTDKVGTRWKLSAIPLGGYVKMFGEDDVLEDENGEERTLSPEERAVSFSHKRLGQRAAIVAAGPIANFLLAIVLMAGLFSLVGIPKPYAGIGTIKENSAAAQSGFQVGDRIISISGEPVVWFDDLRRIIGKSPGVSLDVTVVRKNAEIVLTTVPNRQSRQEKDGRFVEYGLLGVTPDVAQIGYERQNPLMAMWLGVEKSYDLTAQILTALGEMISGSRGADELGGPIRIAQISGEMAQGGVVNIIFFMAALSVNLGLINLFPVPMLDGGHLVFYAVEVIRRRPLGRKAQEYGFRFGLILVLLLMIFATWNDLVRLYNQLIT
ncbi:MAG: RIP metalloprotease RseP [Rhodospirillales bacterium]|nr:RIP metalloprotease RseP [Rhodospirillales bacterium]